MQIKHGLKNEYVAIHATFLLIAGLIIVLVAGICYGSQVAYVNDHRDDGYVSHITRVDCVNNFGDYTCKYTLNVWINSANYTCYLHQVKQPVMQQDTLLRVDVDKRTANCQITTCSSKLCYTKDSFIALIIGASSVCVAIALCCICRPCEINAAQILNEQQVLNEHVENVEIRIEGAQDAKAVIDSVQNNRDVKN